MTASILMATRLVIGFAYGLQLIEICVLPVPSSFSTYSLLSRVRDQGCENPIPAWRWIVPALCALGAMAGALLSLLCAVAPQVISKLGLLFIPTPCSCVAGSLLVAIGSALTLVAVLTLRRQGRFDTQGENEILITRGVFSLLRHPIGAGLALIYLGFWLLVPSVWVGMGFVLFSVNARLRMEFEEAELRHRFGADYQAYAQRVGAFLPRLGRSSTME